MTIAPTFNSWVTCARPNPRAQLRLFCFPHAGGSASFFRPWSEELPASIEVCPIQYPGRENRLLEPPFTQLTLLVETLAPFLIPLAQMPFAFYGHSLGALIGFELARQLRRLGARRPAVLFVSSYPAPQIGADGPPIHGLPDAEFIASVQRFNGMPAQLSENREMMELMLPILRADFALYETHACADELPLDCPIMAFGGIQDKHIRREQLEAWHVQTSGSFALRMFPGDHFFLQTARSLLLQAITRDLARACAA